MIRQRLIDAGMTECQGLRLGAVYRNRHVAQAGATVVRGKGQNVGRVIVC